MQVSHFYHRHNMIKLSKHADFSYFEFGIWLHTLALSLSSVFIPIMLLQSGYDIKLVIVFYLVFNLIDIPLNFLTNSLMRKIGAKQTLILGTVFKILFFGLLAILPANNLPFLLVLAVFKALYDTLFWISHVYLFIEANRDIDDTGSAVGSLNGIRNLASMLGPAVGAAILIFGGKTYLVAASIVFFALSIIPLYKMKHVNDIPKDDSFGFKQFFADAKARKNHLSLALWGVHSEAEDILWPLFIFTVVGTVGSVAAIPILISITTVLFSFFAGKLSNKYSTRMVVIGSFLISAIWLARLFFQGAPFYYWTILSVGFLALLIIIPLDRAIISHGLSSSSLAAATYRNMMSMSLRAALYAVLLILVGVFHVSFIMASLSLFVLLAFTIISRVRANSSL